MTVKFSHYPFLEPANPLVGQLVRSRAESRSPGLGVRTSKAGCALEAWAAPCSLAVAATPYSACSSAPVTAGGLTPSLSPRALGALLPHRLHRASVAPPARPCVSTCPQDTGCLALNASAAIFAPRIPGPCRMPTRYPLRQRPIAGGGGSREPIGSEEASAHPSPAWDPPSRRLFAVLLRLLRVDCAWSSGTVLWSDLCLKLSALSPSLHKSRISRITTYFAFDFAGGNVVPLP